MKKNTARTSTFVLSAISLALTACGSGDDEVVVEEAAPNSVQKASCGAGDKPETALQGQVPAAMRAAGFQGFNCNLQLVAQSKNEGGSWQAAFFEDRAGNKCGYYDSSSVSAGRTKRGTAVINTTKANTADATTFLTTTAMLDPWESLKVNERRQLLGGVNAQNGNGGPEIDLYDISGDCRNPQLLSSAVGRPERRHRPVRRGSARSRRQLRADGLTYYGANLGVGLHLPDRHHQSDQAEDADAVLHRAGPGARPHHQRRRQARLPRDSRPGARQSHSGRRRRRTTTACMILDMSRGPGARAQSAISVVGQVIWDDGGGAQHTIDVTINGKPYVILVDEAGSGGNSSAGWAARLRWTCRRGSSRGSSTSATRPSRRSSRS